MLVVFRSLAVQLTVILLLHCCNGFMFNSWLRSTTEENLSTAQYKYQQYANGAQIQNRYETPKESSKSNINAFPNPTDKDVIAAYNQQRTGISAPPKQGKPGTGYNAVVVQSIPSYIPPSPAISYVAIPAAHNYPYFYYRDDSKTEQNIPLSAFTTSLPPRKSVQVELNYKDDTTAEQQKPSNTDTSTPSSTEGAFNKTEISNQIYQEGTPKQLNVKSTVADESANNVQGGEKSNLPHRPIKLVGLSPVYTVPQPFQKYPNNFTFVPQFYYEPSPNVQYAPYAAPPYAYRNIPRAVSDRSEVPASSSVPVINPISFIQYDTKLENKPLGAAGGIPICDNCLLPSNYFPYPTGLRLLGASGAIDNHQKPCQHETTTNAPSYKSNFAYLFGK